MGQDWTDIKRIESELLSDENVDAKSKIIYNARIFAYSRFARLGECLALMTEMTEHGILPGQWSCPQQDVLVLILFVSHEKLPARLIIRCRIVLRMDCIAVMLERGIPPAQSNSSRSCTGLVAHFKSATLRTSRRHFFRHS